MEKVSLITTVLNENTTIDSFLDSIAEQTHKPNEIIIVDAGSTDGTIEKIKSYMKSMARLNIRLFYETGNIAHGRNTAIKNARFDRIAVSDVGCILHKNWLKHLTEAFDKHNADVVAGYYTPSGSTFFQKCLATYTSVMPNKLNKATFLPSSRSIAFTKTAWKQVGGYPENLNTAEDLVFARDLKQASLRFVPAFEALVFWPQRETWKEAFQQFFRYAQGDGKALYFRPQTPLLGARVFLALTLIGYALSVHSIIGIALFLFYAFFYWLYAVLKNYHYVPQWRALLYLPSLQVISDAAVSLGMISGFLKRYAKV